MMTVPFLVSLVYYIIKMGGIKGFIQIEILTFVRMTNDISYYLDGRIIRLRREPSDHDNKDEIPGLRPE
jgi:hypothetical protein